MLKRILSAELLEIDPRRIGLVKPCPFREVVQSLPLLPVFRDQFPQAHIAWVIEPQLSELVAGHPYLDEILSHPFDNSGTGWKNFLSQIRKKRFDFLLDLHGTFRSGLIMAAGRASWRVGLESATLPAQLTYNVLLPDSGPPVPRNLRYWKAAEAIGRGDARRQTLITIDKRIQAWTRQQLQGLRGPLLAVHPGNHWATRRWPIEYFAVVACKAMRFFGLSVVILGDRSERPVAKQLERLLRRFMPARPALNLAGKTSLKQLAAVLSGSKALLAHDSGPLHLALGLGTPAVGIFSCTESAPVLPMTSQHKFECVVSPTPCPGSHRRKCLSSKSYRPACLREIEIEQVTKAFFHLIKSNRVAARAA